MTQELHRVSIHINVFSPTSQEPGIDWQGFEDDRNGRKLKTELLRSSKGGKR